jgi:hypothetical protein
LPAGRPAGKLPCVKITRKLLSTLALFVAVASAQAEELTPLEWTQQYLIATWTPGAPLVAFTDGMAADAGSRSPRSLDNAVELLVRISRLEDTAIDKYDSRALSAFIARTKTGRYKQAMELILAEGKRDELDAGAYTYLRENRRAAVEQYVPGSIDLTKLGEAYAARLLATRPDDTRAQALGRMHRGGTIAELFALAGPPDHITTRQFRLSAAADFRRLFFYYRGIGRAVFALDAKRGWLFMSAVVDAMAFEDEMPYRDHWRDHGLPDDAELRMIQLASGSMPAMKVAIETTIRRESATLEFLDTAAQFLHENHVAPADEIVEDLCAWAARLLIEQGGPRYKRVLAATAQSKTLKLRKYAEFVIRKQSNVPPEPFIPGSVSLAAQARKHPTLYPEVAFRSGRL